MGDTDSQKPEIQTDSYESTKCEVTTPSIDILKEVKSSENISIEPTGESPTNTAVVTDKPSEATETKTDGENKPKIEDEKAAKVSDESKDAKDSREWTESHDARVEAVKFRNKSDIFSLNEDKNMSSTIYSVGGAPAKTISIPFSASNNTIKTQSSNASKQFRNPVTGIGVSSNDEFKNKPSKRKDGNPLLGLGYKDESPAPTGHRIPPGGYSKGLW